MMRAIVFVLIVAFGLAALWASEHSDPPNANLPMVNAAMPLRPDPPMLFAPCPLSQRNFRRYEERKA